MRLLVAWILVVGLTALEASAATAFIPPERMGGSIEKRFVASMADQSHEEDREGQGYLMVRLAGYQNQNVGNSLRHRTPRFGVGISSQAFDRGGDMYKSLLGVNKGSLLLFDIVPRRYVEGLQEIRGKKLVRTHIPISTADDMVFEAYISSIPEGESDDIKLLREAATSVGGLFGAGAATGAVVGYIEVATNIARSLLRLDQTHNHVAAQKTLVVAPSAQTPWSPDDLRPGGLLFYDSRMVKWVRTISNDREIDDEKWEFTGGKLRYRGRQTVAVPDKAPHRTNCSYLLIELSYHDTVILQDDIVATYNVDAYGIDAAYPNRFGAHKTLNQLIKRMGGGPTSLADLSEKLGDCEKDILSIDAAIEQSTSLTPADKARLRRYYKKQIDYAYDHYLKDHTLAYIRDWMGGTAEPLQQYCAIHEFKSACERSRMEYGCPSANWSSKPQTSVM